MSPERKDTRGLVVVRTNADQAREEPGPWPDTQDAQDGRSVLVLPPHQAAPLTGLDSLEAKRRVYFAPGGYAVGKSIRTRLTPRTSRPRE